ncbi:MAG: LytR C-terminal domain-containing protein [Sporichthyaceae bacterium]|nr:LytR C-terminal domain-containing protein [Sporichthyaceae bacterium]
MAAPGQVRVNVYNATDKRGLAARVAGQLERRGFRVKQVDNDPAKRTVTSAAEVRHSASGASAARAVAAQVGAVIDVPDGREDSTVDLVLGTAFARLTPREDAATALSDSPRPRSCVLSPSVHR